MNGKVTIPGLGVLSLIRVPSTNDFANKLLQAPMYRYHFEKKTQTIDTGLMRYLKINLQLSEDQIQNELTEFSHVLNERLGQFGELDWQGLGLFKRSNNSLMFIPSNNEIVFGDTIKYEHVVRNSTIEHHLTIDGHQSSEEYDAYLNEQEAEKIAGQWKLFSKILFIISILFLLVRFMIGNFSILDARYHRVEPKQAKSNYSLIKPS